MVGHFMSRCFVRGILSWLSVVDRRAVCLEMGLSTGSVFGVLVACFSLCRIVDEVKALFVFGSVRVFWLFIGRVIYVFDFACAWDKPVLVGRGIQHFCVVVCAAFGGALYASNAASQSQEKWRRIRTKPNRIAVFNLYRGVLNDGNPIAYRLYAMS